jgi:hypothetical protein
MRIVTFVGLPVTFAVSVMVCEAFTLFGAMVLDLMTSVGVAGVDGSVVPPL